VGSSHVYKRESQHIYSIYEKKKIYLGESTVIPNISVMREAVADITQATFLDVLLNRIERFLFGYFHLCVGPSRNFDNHVQDTIVLISEKRDVVKRRHDGSILFDENTVF
jgi:hypothetical protein